jgi:hypothetical protein
MIRNRIVRRFIKNLRLLVALSQRKPGLLTFCVASPLPGSQHGFWDSGISIALLERSPQHLRVLGEELHYAIDVSTRVALDHLMEGGNHLAGHKPLENRQ